MNMEQAAERIHPLIAQFVEQHFEVLFASACTEDGFVIAHGTGRQNEMEEDTMAALSSTLLSMAEAAARVVDSGSLKVTVIEAQKANLVLIRTQCQDLPVVLTVGAKAALSVGQALFLANRLSDLIQGL